MRTHGWYTHGDGGVYRVTVKLTPLLWIEDVQGPGNFTAPRWVWDELERMDLPMLLKHVQFDGPEAANGAH